MSRRVLEQWTQSTVVASKSLNRLSGPRRNGESFASMIVNEPDRLDPGLPVVLAWL